MDNDAPSEPIPLPQETPQDLYTLYLSIRASLGNMRDFNSLYLALLNLVDVGKECLPPECESLREEAEGVLVSETYYPEARQLELTDEGYRVGPENSNTGLVHVRPEHVQTAIEEVKNQQATKIIPRLKRIDSKIFKALVESGLIEIKKPSVEELMAQNTMMAIQKKAEEMKHITPEVKSS